MTLQNCESKKFCFKKNLREKKGTVNNWKVKNVSVKNGAVKYWGS